MRIKPNAIEEYEREHTRVWPELERDPVNQRWQEFMGRLFAEMPDTRPGSGSRC